MAELQLKLSDGRGRPVRLRDEPITIGRHPDNRLRIKTEKASRHHAILEPFPEAGAGAFRIRDLGSRNGTKLNGMSVTESVLTSGDVIAIGGLEFVVEERGGDKALTSERKVSSNGRGRTRATDDSGENAVWVQEIKQILTAFERGAAPDDDVRIIDARGESTGALAGTGDGPRAVRMLLRTASRTKATDIHVEPKGDESVHIRMRVDGVMVWICELPRKASELAAGLIKTACQMQAAARDAIQEGHFSCRFPDRRVEYRVSFTPSVHGQKLVLRVLDNRDVPTAISDLGLLPYMREKIEKVTQLDAGMLLACGPTGSGKTTTLYNALREIDRDARNVITIEDPVEYQLDGVTQMPIDEGQGNTFYSMLRSVLRQDPDVILLGEIRDEDTARTAMQAAMTGHLVFSTVHAKDTIAAIFRILDLKVEPYLVANSISLVLAQRLVRTLCDHCKAEQRVPPGLASRMGRYGTGVSKCYAPVGCKNCLKTGYRGRHALFELLDVNDELRDVILEEPSIQAMRQVIKQGHFTTLAEFGWKLVAEGSTSVEEVDRVAGGK